MRKRKTSRLVTPKGYKFLCARKPKAKDFKVMYVEIVGIVGPTKSHNGAFTLSWGTKGAGFGTAAFLQRKDGKVECQNEMMSKNFVKEVLAKMVDDAIFTETHEDLPR